MRAAAAKTVALKAAEEAAAKTAIRGGAAIAAVSGEEEKAATESAVWKLSVRFQRVRAMLQRHETFRMQQFHSLFFNSRRQRDRKNCSNLSKKDKKTVSNSKLDNNDNTIEKCSHENKHSILISGNHNNDSINNGSSSSTSCSSTFSRVSQRQKAHENVGNSSCQTASYMRCLGKALLRDLQHLLNELYGPQPTSSTTASHSCMTTYTTAAGPAFSTTGPPHAAAAAASQKTATENNKSKQPSVASHAEPLRAALNATASAVVDAEEASKTQRLLPYEPRPEHATSSDIGTTTSGPIGSSSSWGNCDRRIGPQDRSSDYCSDILKTTDCLSLKVVEEKDTFPLKKIIFACKEDQTQIVAVVIRTPQRLSLSISSQVGCAFGCSLASAELRGFQRQLTTDELADQVLYCMLTKQRPDSIAFSGEGEPLGNPRVFEVLHLLTERRSFAFSARKLSVFTLGIAPGLRKLNRDHPQVNLALLLQSPFNEERNLLVPANRIFPLAEIFDLLDERLAKTGRRIWLLYHLKKDRNDSEEHARGIAALIRSRRRATQHLYHLHVVPYNTTTKVAGEKPNESSTKESIKRFTDILQAQHISVALRRWIDPPDA